MMSVVVHPGGDWFVASVQNGGQLAFWPLREVYPTVVEGYDILVRPRTLELSVASLGLAFAVAGACILIGVPVAWLVTLGDVPGGRWWLVAMALPLAVPSYVAAYTWLADGARATGLCRQPEKSSFFARKAS